MRSRVEGSNVCLPLSCCFHFRLVKALKEFWMRQLPYFGPWAEGCGSALPGSLLWHFRVSGSRTHCRTSHDGWQPTPDRLKFTRKVMPFDLEHSRDYMNFETNRRSLRKSVMGVILFLFEYLPRNKRSVFASQIIDF